jgi:uncharacterized delta-60 repeat protein
MPRHVATVLAPSLSRASRRLPANARQSSFGALIALAWVSACIEPDTPQIDEPGTTGSDATTEISTDDGDADSTTGDPITGSESSSGPTQPVCGDGVVDPDEQCDEGEANAESAACLPDCTAAACGDGFVHDGVEGCDDANDDDEDGCTNACVLVETCGDAIVQPPEECDDGRDNADNAACKADCTAATCGDGITHTGVEECDDANADNNDPCTELCTIPVCGDGFPQTINGELCDDGDGVEGDDCNADCDTSGLWTATYNGNADNNDVVNGVAVDGSGNVIAVGATFDAAQNDDVWIRKYGPDGAVQWTQTYHAVTSDIGRAVAVAGSDDIFVAGSSFTLNDDRDIWVRRYDPSGGGGFIVTANGAGNGADEALGIAIDPSGNLLVAGYVTTAAAGRDIWLRKYTAAGATLWTRTAAGTGGQNDEGHAVASDAAGNVIVTGFAWAGADERDVWVRKYDPDGDELWTATHDGPASASDEGNGVATDSAGNVIVTGYEETAAQGRDVWVRKYDPDGAEIWTQTYNAPQDATDIGRGVAVDADDAIVVGGSIFRGPQSDNVWVRKYDPDGAEIWTVVYNSDAFLSDIVNAVAVDADDDVVAGGFETRSDLGEARNAWVRYILQ